MGDVYFTGNPSTRRTHILADCILPEKIISTKKPIYRKFPAYRVFFLPCFIFSQEYFKNLFYKCFYFLVNAFCIQTIFFDQFECRTGLTEHIIDTDL